MQRTWNTPAKPWNKQIRRKAIVTGFIGMFVINFILTTSVAIMFRAADVINHDYSAFSRKFYRDLSKDPSFLTTLFVAEVVSYMLAVLIAARFNEDRSTRLSDGGYWDPVAWREVPESCP